uniref:Arginine-containing cyclodipeptide synthase avaA n=1 Tax=Aspergillus versicolor TaxID=46472 RepID=AVAA_ASPVE|nr:AvaA [Aspergillus versicolor]
MTATVQHTVKTEVCLRGDVASQPISDSKPPTWVAVLQQHEYQSSVTYHKLDDNRLIPDVFGYSYLRDIADQGKKQSTGKQHARVIQAYSKIHSLLSPPWKSSSIDSNTKTRENKGSPVILEDKRCAFIERLEPPPNSKADIVSTVFAQVNLQTPTGPPLEQFLSCRASNIKANDLKNAAEGVRRPITISTGICLFSSRLLGFIPTNGLSVSHDATETVVPPLPYTTVATFYELETCTRMAMTIAGLAVTASTGGTAGSRPIVVRLDVPNLQYYCYPLELLEAGLVSWEYVEEWFRLVDRRHRQVATLLKDTIIHEVRRRNCDVQVDVTSGTIAATQLLRLCVLGRRKIPSVNDMLFVLSWIGPYQAAWREFLAIVDDCQRPKDLRSLALMAYVFEVMYPALQQATTKTKTPHGKGEESSGRPLLIQVDDIAEWRIFDRAEMLLKRFKHRQHGLDPLLVGVFPSPRIFTSEDQGRSTLFLHDPGLKISQTRPPSSGGDSEDHSCVVGPLDIIGQIYGAEVQDTLMRLIIERGLSPEDEFELD